MMTYVTFQKSMDDLFDAYRRHLESPSISTKAEVDECYDLCIEYVNCKTFAKAWRMKLYTIGDFNSIDDAVKALETIIRDTMASMEGIG